MASRTILIPSKERASRPGPSSPLPPFRRNGHDGDGGDRFGPPPRRLPISNGVLGMGILLCSLTMLFSGMMSAYVVLRSTAGSAWPPPGVPPLPSGLWISTLVLLASSATLAWSQRTVRSDRAWATTWGLLLTTVLGIAFLAVQTVLWRDVFVAGLTQRSQYGALFFTLTGTHAAHVIGGLVMLLVVSLRSLAGRYNARSHEGVTLAAMYWHFLGIIWIALFTVLYLVH